MKGMKISVVLALILTLGLAMPMKDVAAVSQTATAQVEAAVTKVEKALKEVAIGFAPEKAYLNGLIEQAEAVLAGEVDVETANLPELTAALEEGAQALIYRAGAAKAAAAKTPDTDMTTGATTAHATQAIATTTTTDKANAVVLANATVTSVVRTTQDAAKETTEENVVPTVVADALDVANLETDETATIAAASMAAVLAALMTVALLEMVRRDEKVCGVAEAKRA